MGRYDLFLKQVKARVDRKCVKCGASISRGETYFRETVSDRFLQSLHSRAFCKKCYNAEGNALLRSKVGHEKKADHNIDEFSR